MKAKNKKHESAIVALLSTDSIKSAARECNLSEVTLWRYMQDKDFQQAFRKARRQAVEGAISRLQLLANEAVDTLARQLSSENTSVAIRAAQLVLDHSIKGVELIDMEERIAAIEEFQQKLAMENELNEHQG